MNSKLPSYLLVLLLITVVLRIIIIPYYDNNFGGIEPNIIYGIQRILLGQPLYQDPSSGTYAIIQYTPLYYYFVAGVAKVISPDNYRHGLDVHGLYTLSRSLALVLNLLTVAISVLFIRRCKLNWWQSLAYAGPVLICLTAHYYTRGDSMHLLFFVAALYTYILYLNKNQILYLLLSALCCALCIMSKQSGVLCVGIICFSLFFIVRKYAMGVLYAVTVACMAFSIVWLLTNDDWLAIYQNTVLGLKNGIDTGFLLSMFLSHYFLDMVPGYFLGGVMVYLAFRSEVDKTFRTLAAGAALSWLFAAITGLKEGSSNNYFTEFLVCLFLALPYILRMSLRDKIIIRFRSHVLTAGWLATIALIVLVSSKVMGLCTGVYIEKSFKNDIDEYTREQALYNYFIHDLSIKKGEHIFFTERRFLDNLFIEYAIMPVKDVATQVYRTDHSTFNYTTFGMQANNGLVKYIVTDERRAGINVCNDSMPFIFFDKHRFRKLANVSGYAIFRYVPPDAWVLL